MFSFLLLGLAAHAAAPARPIGPPHGPTVSLGAGYIWMDPAESIGNAAAILALPNVDGGLVGGASLVAADFLAIARAAG